MSENKKTRLIKWEFLIAGTVGGVASTAVFHPLELIKLRYQVNEQSQPKFLNIKLSKSTKNVQTPPVSVYRPEYKNLLDSVIQIYRTENGIRGLYRGLSINVLASGLAWGSYFLIYNTMKARRDQNEASLRKAYHYTLDATVTGIVVQLFTNPFFLIKTRMCLQYARLSLNTIDKNSSLLYKNSLDAFKKLIKSDGYRGMFKGLIPGMAGTFNGTIQMVSYDMMKASWLKYINSNKAPESTDKTLNSTHYLLFSGLSKSFSVVATYPFQLIRSRLQDQHRKYNGIVDVVRSTYKLEGFVGFYKGLIPCLLRVTPAACLTFIVYENLLLALKDN